MYSQQVLLANFNIKSESSVPVYSESDMGGQCRWDCCNSWNTVPVHLFTILLKPDTCIILFWNNAPLKYHNFEVVHLWNNVVELLQYNNVIKLLLEAEVRRPGASWACVLEAAEEVAVTDSYDNKKRVCTNAVTLRVRQTHCLGQGNESNDTSP